jgi:hypothetical protein
VGSLTFFLGGDIFLGCLEGEFCFIFVAIPGMLTAAVHHEECWCTPILQSATLRAVM